MPGKKKPVTRYLGAVNPKRKSKIDWRGVLSGVAAMGVSAAIGKLGPPGARAYHDKHRASARTEQTYRAAERQLDEKYGIDRSSAEAWRASHARLPDEMLREKVMAERAAAKELHAARAEAKAGEKAAAGPTAPMSDPSEAPAPDDAPDTAPAGEGKDDASSEGPATA